MENNVDKRKKCEVLPTTEDRKLLVKDVNNFLICRLCGGYLIDATGLIECTHTYCRSCIVQFLQKSSFCPICEVQVNRTQPLHSLRPDSIIQRLVYKTVPGLYKSELLRRQRYLNDLETKDVVVVVNDDDCPSQEYYFDPEEPISISLEYVEYVGTVRKQSDESEDLIELQNDTLTKKLNEQITYKRYLQCPAALKIRHIYKFIKLKYNLKKTHEVEILYENTKLPSYFSLMDTAYTFSWNREKPMRLCYQIFERKVIQVPLVMENEISDAYAPPKNDFVSDSSSSLNNSSETSKMEDEQPLSSALDSPCKNLKRKCESSLEDEKISVTDKRDFMHGLELKIPRISVDILPRNEEPKNELKTSDSCSSLCSDSGSKVQVKTPSNDSGTYSDDYVKYEQDIEEVDEDDDDDEDRLRISQMSDEEMPSEEKTENVSVEQPVVISTLEDADKDAGCCSNDTEELAKSREDRKTTKSRRKNKKSKHHHHRRHHHRHHDRKKMATQATILHSPDTDIMKLKVKLNTVVPAAESSKHHKQSRRKRRRSPETYFSSSSPSSRASSVTASSPDHANSISRADEDSFHSHVSEISSESIDVTAVNNKEEVPKIPETVSLSPPTPALTQASPVRVRTSDEQQKEQPSPGTKEKLLQMRAFRPKCIAVVKPEESDKKITPVDNAKITTVSKNDNNNNKHAKVSAQVIEKPIPASILRPASSSSITVSKITAAEKRMMEQEKRMNGISEERPSLEITLVSEPARTCSASPTSSVTFPDSVSTTTAKVKPSIPRTMKPLPALVQLPAAKTTPKGVSIIPRGKQQQPHQHGQHRSVKLSSNSDVSKKINENFPLIKTDGTKQSVTISLSGNHFHPDLIPGALDLSGKQCAGRIFDNVALSKNAAAIAAAQVSLFQQQQQQNAKKAYVQPYGGASSIQQQPPVTTTSLPYNPVNSMASLAESRRLVQSLASKEAAAQFQYMFGSGGGLPFPIMQSPKHSHHGNHRMFASPPHTSPGAQVIGLSATTIGSNANNNNNSYKTGKVSGLPALNEIKIGPVSSSTENTPQPKPVPNQNVRNIPNPSRLLRRQQPVGSVGPMLVSAANGIDAKCNPNGGGPIVNSRLVSTPCSFTNHKKNGEKCLQAVLPKEYIDHSNIMATK